MNRYPLKPNRITASRLSYSIRKVEFEESSYVQKIATRRTPKRSFTLEHYLLDRDAEAILTNFFNQCKGSVGTFIFYNHIDGIEYDCSFKSDTLTVQRINASFCNISIEVETC